MNNICNLLLRVVRRVGKYSRVKPAFDTITAKYYNAVLVSLQELIIE